jgi:hypothetical protein
MSRSRTPLSERTIISIMWTRILTSNAVALFMKMSLGSNIWLQYLVEWRTARPPAQKEFKVGDIVHTMDIFQQGPFHPNFPGQQALLRALIDSIRNIQRVEIRDDEEL